jgi:translation initiation factor 6 (eIF-6)
MPPAKHREPIIPAKVKSLIEELLHQRVYDLKAAAEKAGLTHYLARRYLRRPNVLRFFREERAAMLEEICAGNAAALAAVRLSDNGMAVAAAVRQLEAMRQTVAEETSGGRAATMPGLVIVITQPDGSQQMIPPAPPPMIDVTPEREALGSPEAQGNA